MTHGSLFSGIGGFDLGAERAGFQNLWACEIDEFKQAILRKHFPDTHIYSDIKMINPPYVDVISGGFPCQDISQSQFRYKNNRYGNYGIKGERSGLKEQKDEKMTLIAPMNLKYKTPITQDLIKEKFAPTIKQGTLSMRTGTIRYMIDKELKLWVNFEEKIKGKSKIYIDCSGCECKLEVKYMEQIDWVIKKLKKTEKEIRNRVLA